MQNTRFSRFMVENTTLTEALHKHNSFILNNTHRAPYPYLKDFTKVDYLRRAVSVQSWARDVLYTSANSEASYSVLIEKIHGAIQAPEEEYLANINDGKSFRKPESNSLNKNAMKPTFPSHIDPSALTNNYFSSGQPMYEQPYASQQNRNKNQNKTTHTLSAPLRKFCNCSNSNHMKPDFPGPKNLALVAANRLRFYAEKYPKTMLWYPNKYYTKL